MTTISSQSSSSPRILLPAHPTSPLPPALRNSIISLLISKSQVSELRSAISTYASDSDWESRVRGRIMELLASGEAETTQHLRAIIMAEALGRPVDRDDVSGSDEEDEEEADDSARETEGRKNSAKRNERKEEGENGKKIDIKIPQEAIDAGTRVVRMTLEKHADIAPETTEEERQWRDWR